MAARSSSFFPWRRKGRAGSAPTVPLADPRALLALVPEPHLGAAIRDAVQAAGVEYTVPVRITVQAGLDARDEDSWRATVRDVARRHEPFTVRLVGPEVIRERSVCLRVVGRGAALLADDLRRSLGGGRFAPGDTDDTLGPVLPLAGTWTGMSRTELHELATGVRDELRVPVEFRATTLYAFEDAAADDDLPFLEFALGGG